MTGNDDIYGRGYQHARREAFARSNSICQGCGQRDAAEAHHWAGTLHAGPYPQDRDVCADDLTAVCKDCHDFFTETRRRTNERSKRWWTDLMLAARHP